jgi:predicted ATPase
VRRYVPVRMDDAYLDRWPFTIPAVRQVVEDGGLEVPAGVTFLVGENGSGKSTLVEAMAAAYPRAGHAASRGDVVGPVASSEDSPLRWHLRAQTHPLASPAGFFLRAELMHAYLAGRDDDPMWAGDGFNARSHGESFLTVLQERFTEVGVYFMDEPEAALSLQSCLALVGMLDELARGGCQVVVATHSPVLTALPGATILELGEWGIRPTTWEEAEIVTGWRSFLDAPDVYLRHLLDP